MRSSHINVIALLATGMIHLAPGLASATIPGAGPTPHALDPCETNADCTNPNEPICNADDVCAPCTQDSECGAEDSGIVCNPNGGICLQGCRGTGNGCPDGGTCTSIDDTIGKCIPKGEDESSSDSHGDPDSSPDSDASDTSSSEDSSADSKGAPDSSPIGDTEDTCGSDPTETAPTGSDDGAASDSKPFTLDAEDFDCTCDAGARGAGGPLLLVGLVGLAIRRRR
jgi:hypothetical protein